MAGELEAQILSELQQVAIARELRQRNEYFARWLESDEGRPLFEFGENPWTNPETDWDAIKDKCVQQGTRLMELDQVKPFIVNTCSIKPKFMCRFMPNVYPSAEMFKFFVFSKCDTRWWTQGLSINLGPARFIIGFFFGGSESRRQVK